MHAVKASVLAIAASIALGSGTLAGQTQASIQATATVVAPALGAARQDSLVAELLQSTQSGARVLAEGIQIIMQAAPQPALRTERAPRPREVVVAYVGN